MSELENGFRIGDVLAMVRRRLPIVAGAAVVGLLAAYFLYASTEATFSATSRVQVRAIKLNPFEGEGRTEAVDIATEKDLVRSDAVAESVREAVGLTGDNRAILQRITVATEPDSLVLKITFEGDTAKQAQTGANAAAEAYLQQRRDGAAATRDSTVARLNEQIAGVEQALAEAQSAFDAAPDESQEKSQLRAEIQSLQAELNPLQQQRADLNQFDPATVGDIVREAILPPPTTSKMALGMAVGVFGLFVFAGLVIAWLVDHRDSMGGGRRRIEQLVPGANIRVMPGAEGASATPAEIDTAIDRLAVELVAGSSPGKPASVLVIGAGMEPPIALAEELASSLAFAGIPALFVLAGSSERMVRGSTSIASFADHVANAGAIGGPAALPAAAGEGVATAAPTVTWLRPKGSAEAAGLLRRAVVDTLVTRAGRERYEAVVFVAPSPTRTAAGAALGKWVARTALVIGPDERSQAEPAAEALAQADVRVTEVIWT